MKIELNIFTNSGFSSPSTEFIEKTFDSFETTFDYTGSVKVWCDPNPNLISSDQYIDNLEKLFKNVSITSSLSDGYIQAVKQSDADFLFMLEHDWTFNRNIKHSLEEICTLMEKEELMHLRFNKRKNKAVRSDTSLLERKAFIPYCITPFISNNPHIIHRQTYIELALNNVKNEPGSKGIEYWISQNPNISGAIYGGLAYPNTVYHIDGRKKFTLKKLLAFFR